jgi:hypothetical protein
MFINLGRYTINTDRITHIEHKTNKTSSVYLGRGNVLILQSKEANELMRNIDPIYVFGDPDKKEEKGES